MRHISYAWWGLGEEWILQRDVLELPSGQDEAAASCCHQVRHEEALILDLVDAYETDILRYCWNI